MGKDPSFPPAISVEPSARTLSEPVHDRPSPVLMASPRSEIGPVSPPSIRSGRHCPRGAGEGEPDGHLEAGVGGPAIWQGSGGDDLRNPGPAGAEVGPLSRGAASPPGGRSDAGALATPPCADWGCCAAGLEEQPLQSGGGWVLWPIPDGSTPSGARLWTRRSGAQGTRAGRVQLARPARTGPQPAADGTRSAPSDSSSPLGAGIDPA